MSTSELSAAFFIAVVAILVVCRAVSWLVKLIGQPPVVGEMVAGVVLGPSVLGLLAPGVEDALFPKDLRPVLYVVGQVGLVTFMFFTGYEFKTERIRSVARPAAFISSGGILVPMLLGIGITWFAFGKVDVFPAHVSLLVSTLFVGVTLSITAFPMLARIIIERDLTNTPFGSISLASGALDDAVAWVLLAGVMSIAAASGGPIALAVGGAAVFSVLLIVVVRWRDPLARLSSRVPADQLVLIVVVALLVAAWYTDTIGLYAVFGAFSLGVVFPRTPEVDGAVKRLTPISAVFLPLFFTYSGLNTDFGLLFHPALMIFAFVCLVAAIVGKFGACWFAARLAGEKPAIALRVGTLMNARGLMQLIAINLGLAAGIVTKSMFSVLVIVALVTTLMATPLLTLWDRLDRRRQRKTAAQAAVGVGS
ncbi:MAG TPA: cation:proton antiporter [Stackebrandtia sp.]|jgi:Kef-type K+ transport system membrane component KefB|uniref:cation:proton antiporter n=1 Tax=Stackebrandtia sp. TaxID=2023065 RepID=UPI002D2730FF|nr:cation:proton antiporter [Stackebrandtia sp.]HZE37548.1 cation:proton antiporter [Stackebrandtia sp.]